MKSRSPRNKTMNISAGEKTKLTAKLNTLKNILEPSKSQNLLIHQDINEALSYLPEKFQIINSHKTSIITMYLYSPLLRSLR